MLIEKFLNKEESKSLYDELYNDLDWLSVVKARKEYFMSTIPNLKYSYGNPLYANEYFGEPFTKETLDVLNKLNGDFGTQYNVVFLNRYDSAIDHIGWHSDDSPEMDTNHPICVITLGQTRRIQTVEKAFIKDKSKISEFNLTDGSLFVMPAGFQETHYHRIPKEGFECRTRISLTFRRYRHG